MGLAFEEGAAHWTFRGVLVPGVRAVPPAGRPSPVVGLVSSADDVGADPGAEEGPDDEVVVVLFALGLDMIETVERGREVMRTMFVIE